MEKQANRSKSTNQEIHSNKGEMSNVDEWDSFVVQALQQELGGETFHFAEKSASSELCSECVTGHRILKRVRCTGNIFKMSAREVCPGLLISCKCDNIASERDTYSFVSCDRNRN